LVNVELHLPDPQVIAPEAVLFESRILFVDPCFVRLIERLLLLLQRYSLAARVERVELVCRQNDGVDSPILLDEYRFGLGMGAYGTEPIFGLCRSYAHGCAPLGILAILAIVEIQAVRWVPQLRIPESAFGSPSFTASRTQRGGAPEGDRMTDLSVFIVQSPMKTFR
jgi:hypothetical protein